MADNPLLELAESYYTVARDLERNAREQLAIAERLSMHADRLCEKNIRETSPEPQGDKP